MYTASPTSVSQLPPGPPSPTPPTPGQKFLNWALGTPPAGRKMTTWRILCGICWAFWTFLFILAMLFAPGSGHFGGFILAALSGFYDWRIWTRRAKYLSMLIIF
jgi:hypothetical protein